jgi:hypothetical protein
VSVHEQGAKGFKQIPKLRDLFAQDSQGIVNQTQRLLLLLIVSHESLEKGCTVGFDKLMEYNLLKKRALLQNLHYLGDGKSWKNNTYTDCTNQKCKRHLGIVKTQHYAKKNWQQVYRTDLYAYETALRVHVGAPINTLPVHAGNTKGALADQIEGAQVHPYIHEIHEIQLQSSYVDHVQSLVFKLLPESKQFILDNETVNLCLELKQLETPLNSLAEYLSKLSQEWVNNPSAYVKSRLQVLKKDTPALVAEQKHIEEQDGSYLKQLQDMERNRVRGEDLDNHLAKARRAITPV